MFSRVCAFLAAALAVAPGCLLVQPLEDVNEGDGGESGAGNGNVGGGAGGSVPGAGGTAGKDGGGAAGRAGSSGSSGSGNPSGGSTSSSGSGGSGADGGDNGQGGGSSGSAASAGASGSGSGGTTGNTNYVHVWTFDGDTQGWALGGASTPDLRMDSTLVYDGSAGDPDDGSLLLTAPFTQSGQTVEVIWTPAVPVDLAGKTLFARVRLESELDASSVSALLFAKSGASFVWGDGGPRSLTTAQGWTTLAFDFDEDVVGQGFDPTQVVELGLNLYGAAEFDTPAELRIDTVGFDVLTRPNCIRDPLLIDDMETPDGEAWVCQTNRRNGGWYVYSDETAGGMMSEQPGEPILLQTLDPPRGDDTQALHFTSSGFTAWGSGIGTNLHLADPDDSTYYDVSAYSGIEFWARGSGNLRVQIQIPKTRSAEHAYPGTCVPTFGIPCDDNYTTLPFALTADWQLYTLPFSSLRQQNYGMPVPFDYRLYSVEFHVPENESVDLWLDDVRLLERECLLDGGSTCQGGSYSACAYGTEVSEVSCAEQCADFGSADCSGTACQCHSPTDLDCFNGVEFFCACLAGSYDCTPEAKVELYQGCVWDSSYGRRDAMLCYAQNGDDCGTSEATCWSN